VSLKRRFRRKDIIKKKKEASEKLAEKVASFENIPNKCLTCKDPFDKLDKEQAMTWHVVVKQQENIVRLYCPICWDKTINFIKESINNDRRQR
tara:strand:+ start:504 stop:782 length:279 start_codon:yes stop_codon:yes gene_type:complete